MMSLLKLFIATVLDGVAFSSNARKQTLFLSMKKRQTITKRLSTKIFIVNLRQSAGEITIQVYVRIFDAK